jgi:hypothetical protein
VEIRNELAVELLEMTLQRVLEPLRAQLTKVGDSLHHPDVVEEVSSWPDGAGVGDLYEPPASEFCLLDVDGWDREYLALLGRTEPGSADEARNVMLAGGFKFGPVASRKVMDPAIELSTSGGWWLREGRSARVEVRLEPGEIRDRVRTWMSDASHPFGRFLAVGLSEYLTDDSEGVNKKARLDCLRTQLAGALAMAKPLFDIDESVMNRVHAEASLEIETLAEKFPFDPDHPAREIVAEALAGLSQQQPFRSSNNDGIESVLILSYLVQPVQPAAVKSLYGPIGQQWQTMLGREPEDRPAYIQSLALYRRGRLLTESIPLPSRSIDMIIRGFYLGRLLGVVTNPEQDQPMHVWSRHLGQPKSSTLPWPLLRHGVQSSLHRKSHRNELLPAILEHFGLATLLVSRDASMLDGYQDLYSIGEAAEDHIERWIEHGEAPVGRSVQPLLSAIDGPSRKEEMLGALQSLSKVLDDRDEVGRRMSTSSDYGEFSQVPYGWELIPKQRQQLVELSTLAGAVEAGGGSDYV